MEIPANKTSPVAGREHQIWTPKNYTAVRDASVSLHSGGSIKDPLKPLSTIEYCDGARGFRERVSLMPRDARLSV